MEIKTTYFGKFKKNGKIISGIWCGERPEDAVISEERLILFPDEGKILRLKDTDITFPTVWLKDGDVEENYEEIEQERITPNDITQQNLPPLDSGQ